MENYFRQNPNLKRENESASQWLLQHLNRLKGRTIVEVFVDDKHTGFPVLHLDDDTLVTVQSDPEGNGPGFLRIIPPVEDS